MSDKSTSDARSAVQHQARVLVLRSRSAVERYLEHYLVPLAEAEDATWLDNTEWAAEGNDADERSFRIAVQLNLPILRALHVQPDAEALAQFRPETARRLRMAPIVAHKGLLAVAMENAADGDAIEELNFLSKYRVMSLVSTARAIRERIATSYDHAEDLAMARQLGLDPQNVDSKQPINNADQLANEQPVVRLVADGLADAVRRRASDIHLRPGEHGTDILFRIDDELVQVRRLMPVLVPAIVSRIKVLAGMNLAEHRKPQDGRASYVLDDGGKVDLRVSVLPTIYGESVVVRLLDTRQSLWSLDQLGLSPEDRVRMDEVMSRSHGMFLTTGPTGCGKSTTLYAMLQELRKQRINILTIEDPVEFRIEDVQQAQVNRAAGFTFASAMRNFLRHDPDVIMVGEIRDRETAGIAVECALTGHLMLSTLHTNTAATTVTRLLDLGVEAYLLRSSLLAVMSQRLVRLTCTHCAVSESPDPYIRQVLGVGAEEKFQIGRGCSHCDDLGVHKRRAVYELMVVSPRIRELIVPGADADMIHTAAVQDGMVPLTQTAVGLARQGLISLAEAWRVRAD